MWTAVGGVVRRRAVTQAIPMNGNLGCLYPSGLPPAPLRGGEEGSMHEPSGGKKEVSKLSREGAARPDQPRSGLLSSLPNMWSRKGEGTMMGEPGGRGRKGAHGLQKPHAMLTLIHCFFL